MNSDPPNLSRAIKRLHLFTLYLRWVIVGICWFVFVPLALWNLRSEMSLLKDYFTWSALRYGLGDHLVPSFVLFLTVGMTVAVLVWHSRYILSGISPKEQYRLQKQVRKIYKIGLRHPLWRWLFEPPQK